MIAGTEVQADIARERWYAVYTLPRNEKSLVRSLDARSIPSFLPVYQKQGGWKNRQKIELNLPLFPSYVFVRIGIAEWSRVLSCAGVVRILGSPYSALTVTDSEIELLQCGVRERRVEPVGFAVGQRVRIRIGSLAGMEGVLSRKGNSLRFILTVAMINQHASIEVAPEDIEPLGPASVFAFPPGGLAQGTLARV